MVRSCVILSTSALVLFTLLSGGALGASNLIYPLTVENFTETIEENSYVLVEFFSDFCGHCIKFKDVYHVASHLTREVLFTTVDTSAQRPISKEFHVTKLPTIFLFYEGIPIPYEGQRISSQKFSKWIKETISEVQHPQLFTEEEHSEFIVDAEGHGKRVVIGQFNSESSRALKKFGALSLVDSMTSDFAFAYKILLSESQQQTIVIENAPNGVSTFNADAPFSTAALKQWLENNAYPVIDHASNNIERISKRSVPIVFVVLSDEPTPSEITLLEALKREAINFVESLSFTWVESSKMKILDTLLEDRIPITMIMTQTNDFYTFPAEHTLNTETFTEFLQNYLE